MYFGTLSGEKIIKFSKEDLKNIGIQLYPYVSYRYSKRGICYQLFRRVRKIKPLTPIWWNFTRLYSKKSSAEVYRQGKRNYSCLYKILTEAAEATFIEIKLRALLIQNLQLSALVFLLKTSYFQVIQKQRLKVLSLPNVSDDKYLQLILRITEELKKYKNSPSAERPCPKHWILTYTKSFLPVFQRNACSPDSLRCRKAKSSFSQMHGGARRWNAADSRRPRVRISLFYLKSTNICITNSERDLYTSET